MAWSIGHTLIVILALLAGLAAGWLLRGSPDTSASTTVDEKVVTPPVADAPLGTTSDSTVIDTAPDAATVDSATAPGPTSPEPSGTTSPIATAAPAVPAPRAVADETDGIPQPLADTGVAPVVPASTEVETVPEAEPARTTPAAPGSVTEQLTATEPVVATEADTTQATATAAEETPSVADDEEPVSPAPTTTDSTFGDLAATGVVPTDEPTGAAGVDVAATPNGTEAAATGAAATARTGDAGSATDDLRRIEGIGPKMATVLNVAGIRTYQQLADTDVEALRAVVRAGGARATASLPTWPQQARLLATGGADADAAFPAAGGDEAGA